MVDVAAIVIAVISFAGTVVAVCVATWSTYSSDERKRQTETEKLVAKYRDPLLLASQDLRSRLYGITDKGITMYFRDGGEKKENLLLYTAFVVGQYLSWTYILRRQAQFLRFSTGKTNKDLAKALDGVASEFSSDRLPADGGPFMLWRGKQMAIGEVMTVRDSDELFCIGYAAFHQKWVGNGWAGAIGEGGGASLPTQAPAEKTGGEDGEDGVDTQDAKADFWSGEFRPWFRSIIEDTITITEAKNESRDPVPDQRLRRLQHLLLDLIEVLDEHNVRSKADPCHRAMECNCSRCKGKTTCPCGTCKASSEPVYV
jgi:hypothetical protein